MSKTSPSPAASDDTPGVGSTELTLTEFCRRVSETVRSPELISAFEYTERRAGNLKDAPEAFQARFDSFVNSPV